MSTKITIGLIDDHRALTDAMVSLLSQEEDFLIERVAHNFNDGISLIEKDNCDIYIIDMNLGKEDSCDLIKLADSKNKISIVLSAYSDAALIKKAIKSGAKAYISKSSAATHVTKAINSVVNGINYYDDIIQSSINASMGLADRLETTEEKAMLSQLTPREKEVLNLIGIGYTSIEIAEELCLSKHTVDGYRKRLLQKLKIPVKKKRGFKL